jgi:glycosyltransferase involved in cell wall biosynthesis
MVRLIRPRQNGVTRQGLKSGLQESLVPGLPIPGYRDLRFGLPVYWRLRRWWRANPPDAVYIATEGPLGHAAVSAARSLAIPNLTGFHTQFHRYSSHYKLGLLKDRIIDSLRWFHNRSDGTLVPSATLRDELTGMGFRNVQLLSRGVDTELFHPRRRSTALRESWGCQSDEPVLLYVGRLASEKNLELAVRCLDVITPRIPGTKLFLVGDGPQRERLQTAHPQLVVTGPKVGVDLARHYASADLFLFPSLTETFGNVVLEAMASALPVIAFDYAAAKTHIRSGENGIRVPMDDSGAFIEAAVTLLNDRESLVAMRKQARATAKALSWDRIIQDFETCCWSVIGRNGGQTPASKPGMQP